MLARLSPQGGSLCRYIKPYEWTPTASIKCLQVGTLEYLAPEVLLKEPYSFPADIYSWAVTVNEISTGVMPFSDCTKENPAAHTVLNFGYGMYRVALSFL